MNTTQESIQNEAQAEALSYFYALLSGLVLISAPELTEGARSLHVNAIFRIDAKEEPNITGPILAKMQVALNNAAVTTLGITDTKDVIIHQSVITNVIMLGLMTEAEFRGEAVTDPQAETEAEVVADDADTTEAA